MRQTPSRTVEMINEFRVITHYARSGKGWKLITVLTPEGKSLGALGVPREHQLKSFVFHIIFWYENYHTLCYDKIYDMTWAG
jgi:hypothetical protein